MKYLDWLKLKILTMSNAAEHENWNSSYPVDKRVKYYHLFGNQFGSF